MGHIIGPFGILGKVKVASYTEQFDGLVDYPVWWLKKGDGDWSAMNVASCDAHDNKLLVSFEGCDDRTQALQLKGMQIAIPRDQLPQLSENGKEGYYWSDLIGASVINLQHEEFGNVIGLIRTGANDVLQIQSSDGTHKEKLIPFIDQVIVEVDINARRITVDWGLDY